MAVDISAMSQGYDKSGIEAFSSALMEKVGSISDAVNDIQGIKEAVNNNWAGKAADNFLTYLESDVNVMDGAITKALDALNDEIVSAAAQMAKFDNNLL